MLDLSRVTEYNCEHSIFLVCSCLSMETLSTNIHQPSSNGNHKPNGLTTNLSSIASSLEDAPLLKTVAPLKDIQ